MDLDFKLDKVIEIFDLIKRLSWGAIPLWFALTLPVIYITYSRLLPDRNPNTDEAASGLQRLIRWFSLPRVDKLVIYISLSMFIIGTITLMIDQNQKEKIRNNGLRMKQYFISKNNYAVSRNSLTTGNFKLLNLKSSDIDDVLRLYPNEFLEVDNNTIVLRDSVPLSKIMFTSERLLDNYLSNPVVANIQEIDGLIKQSSFFTREVIYNLIVDSSKKYTYCILSSEKAGIIVNKLH